MKVSEQKPTSTNNHLVERPFDIVPKEQNELSIISSTDLTALTNEFNNKINREIAEVESEFAISEAKKQINIKNEDVGAISSLAKATIEQNSSLTNEQIATKLLEKLATDHPNKFIRKLSKKMVKNKWGERHGG